MLEYKNQNFFYFTMITRRVHTTCISHARQICCSLCNCKNPLIVLQSLANADI